VKEIYASNTDDFKRELTALSVFNKSPHDHLIQLLATFHSKQNHYLLFPYAQGDLSRFWRLNPVVTPTVKTQLWLAEQCLGIASALSKIHNVVEGGLDGQPLAVNEQNQTRFCGVHMDIKPQNILLFQSHQYEPNTMEEATVGARWVLADFGLSQIESSAGALKAPLSRAGYTRTYRAPECDISNDQVSPAYDIWSLGCVFLEIATWIVTGSAGLRNFVDARAEDGDETACYSFFETRIDNITRTVVSSVKPSVCDVSQESIFSLETSYLTYC
jgi:serine/threonine protein kinase